MNPIFLQALANMLFNNDKVTTSGQGGSGNVKPTTSQQRSNRQSRARSTRRQGGRDKMTVSGQRNQSGPPRGAQGPRNPPVQGPSRVTPSAIGGNSGRPNPKPSPNIVDKIGERLLRQGLQSQALRTTARSPGGLLRGLGGAAALFGVLEGLAPARTADGGVEGKPSRPNNQKPTPKPQPKPEVKPRVKPQRETLSPAAIDFDRTFARARAAGLSTFTWRGGVYNTRYAGK